MTMAASSRAVFFVFAILPAPYVAIADENGALTDEPDSGHGERALIGIRHEAAHEVDGKSKEWSCFFAHKFAVHRSRTNGFPVEDVNISGDVIARGQRPELLTDEFTECALPGHRLRFLRVGHLMLGERVNGVAQYFAVQPVLGLEVVICGPAPLSAKSL